MQDDLTIHYPAHPDLLVLTTDLVASYVSGNAVAAEAVPDLIRQVHAALKAVSGGDPPAIAAGREVSPAVPIRKSVFADHIICLEDGQKLQALKRHLRISHGLTPEEYRQRWGLPSTYPMVTPNYTARRAVLAKEIGLGRRDRRREETPPPPVHRIPEGKRGRRAPRQSETV